MRIISGENRGLRLAAVGKGDTAAHLRPTSDRVREAIFNLLMGGAYGDPISNMRVLDLFAGTGALGLEALSRGAAQAVFVENGIISGRILHKNIALCRADNTATVIRRDATRLGPCKTAPFDLIFLDPPYAKGLGETALAAAQTGGWLSANAIVIVEESSAVSAPPDFTLADHRKYGDTTVTILKRET